MKQILITEQSMYNTNLYYDNSTHNIIAYTCTIILSIERYPTMMPSGLLSVPSILELMNTGYFVIVIHEHLYPFSAVCRAYMYKVLRWFFFCQ